MDRGHRRVARGADVLTRGRSAQGGLRRTGRGRTWAVVAAVATVLVMSVGAPASADPTCEKVDPATGQCLITTPPAPQPDDPTDPGTGPGGERVCIFDWVEPEVVECHNVFGTWIDSLQSWCRPADPQPPQDSPIWEGNTEGAIYDCVHGLAGHGVPGTHGGRIWLPGPPEAGPTPRELADQAVAQMDFRAGQIGLAPPTDTMSVVGADTWLWIANPGETTTGPITRTASAGGTTVTATATIDRIEWDMGDGTVVTCTGPGTPYLKVHGNADSPDCGHTYTRSSANQPGEQYTITATTYWTIAWSGGGQSGTLAMDFSRSTQVRVGEIQVLTTL